MLQEGLCGPRVTDIASRLNTTPATVSRRLKRLEDDGDILGYSPRLARKGTVFFVLVRGRVAEHELAGLSEVQEVHACGGNWGFLLKVRVQDSGSYYRFERERLQPLGVSVESVPVYKTFKDK